MAVRRVLRQKARAVHYVDSALEEGSTVPVELDWDRRIDHMQQHSGQFSTTYLVKGFSRATASKES